MPNPDVYLKPGLTPNTDVELYASESAGGYTKAGTGIAQGVAAATKSVTSDRTGTGIANGVGDGGSDITYTKTGTATAEASATGAKAIERARTGTGTAQGVASGTQSVGGSTPSPPSGGGGGGWSTRPAPPPRVRTIYDKTGTAVAMCAASGTSETTNPLQQLRRRNAQVLVLVGAL